MKFALELARACSAAVLAEHTCDRNGRGVRAIMSLLRVGSLSVSRSSESCWFRGVHLSYLRVCRLSWFLASHLLGFGHLVGDGPDARNARLPLLALLGREVL